MYKYDEFDQEIVDQRVTQFREQTQRYLAGELDEEAFRPLRLMNGVYIQTHAPMLRVAIPYGLLSSAQMRKLAHIARTFDRGYGHFSTRQNIQFNWPELAQIPDILAELATVEMHAIQTSGNCVRNITCDPLAGVAEDEIDDPRPYCEILRQWSTLHPEFAYLPRKFKIALSGAHSDRAATAFHDIGFRMTRNAEGVLGWQVWVGGGQGRTPKVGLVMREFLPLEELLTFTEAILRVYNRYGRRDNKYKARIKILVAALGVDAFAQIVEQEWQTNRDPALHLEADELATMAAHFAPPAYLDGAKADVMTDAWAAMEPSFARWLERNTKPHKVAGYAAVYISLKRMGQAPGDATADDMDALAELAERFSFGEIRVTHEQNLVFADVRISELHQLWRALGTRGLANANIGLITDMICCPGLNFCSLANASSIPVAAEISARFDDIDYVHDVGDLELKMSGCMNACGHHHVGHIGILGVDKGGDEYYQLTLGGIAGDGAKIGERLGAALARDQITDAVATLVEVYLDEREPNERFVDTVARIGLNPFKQRVYATA